MASILVRHSCFGISRVQFVQAIFSVLLITATLCRAQSDLAAFTNTHFRAGIVLSVGSHVMRAGFCFNVYYIAGPVQFNTEARTWWNWRSLGPPLRYSELVVSQGIIYTFGVADQPVNFFPGLMSHQTNSRYSIGYAYNLWFNRIGTTQQTGAIAFGAMGWTLISENDIYARPSLDRFRSGGIMIRYRFNDIAEYSLYCKIWTGHYRKKTSVDSIPQFRNNCYMDTTGGTYTRFSHGILAADARFLLPYAQVAGAAAGIDAEQVRDLVQNRLMHNLRFIPQKWLKRKNCHLPMIDEDGDPYLYRNSQSIRKPRPFYEITGNPGIFY